MKIQAFILFVVTGAGAVAAEPVTPPMPPSPIAEFRDWLRKSPEERQVALAKRPEKSRIIIEQKLRDYSAMPKEERERRLDATELRWYLRRLLALPPDQRATALTNVPPLWQPMVMQRLSQWDQMSPSLQKAALDHELMVQYLSTPAPQQAAVLRALGPEDRRRLENRISQWKILPAVERQRMDERLGEFFSMRLEKQRQTLNDFSQEERNKMQKTLQAFRELNQHQRDLCINSFAKFATMQRPEQLAFLKNVERWQAMSQQEREMWREVVKIVPPLPELPAPTPPAPGQP